MEPIIVLVVEDILTQVTAAVVEPMNISQNYNNLKVIVANKTDKELENFQNLIFNDCCTSKLNSGNQTHLYISHTHAKGIQNCTFKEKENKLNVNETLDASQGRLRLTDVDNITCTETSQRAVARQQTDTSICTRDCFVTPRERSNSGFQIEEEGDFEILLNEETIFEEKETLNKFVMYREADKERVLSAVERGVLSSTPQHDNDSKIQVDSLLVNNLTPVTFNTSAELELNEFLDRAIDNCEIPVPVPSKVTYVNTGTSDGDTCDCVRCVVSNVSNKTNKRSYSALCIEACTNNITRRHGRENITNSCTEATAVHNVHKVRLNRGTEVWTNEQMDQQINQQMDQQMDQQINQQMVPQMDQQINQQMDQQINQQMVPQMDQQINQQMDQQINQQMDQQINQQINQQMVPQMDQQINHQMDQQINQQMDQQINQQINQQMVPQMDQQINHQMDQQINQQIDPQMDQQMHQQINPQMHQQINQQINPQMDQRVPLINSQKQQRSLRSDESDVPVPVSHCAQTSFSWSTNNKYGSCQMLPRTRRVGLSRKYKPLTKLI